MKRKRVLSFLLIIAMLLTISAPIVNAAEETLPNGYKIDMEDLPKVHFKDHPEWEEIFDATWQMHKSNIKKIPAGCNPDRPYFVDEAFAERIFAWDTLFMMMFDKYGQNQFPTLSSLDNFYLHQTDKPGQEDDGYIPREIYEETGADFHEGYTDVRSVNPPLWAWAEWEQYQIHGDVSRFSKVIKGKTLFERLVSHFNFIERYKKLANGLYGKTSGLGNGLDNTFNQGWNQGPRGDNETYNDLSIQQAQFAYYIALIAGAMGDTANQQKFEAEHARISALINEKLWSEEAQMYSNIDDDGVTKTNISTPTNLWALLGRVAPPERAEAIIKAHGLNSQKLFRPSGLATAPYDHPDYVPEGGYWQGAVWAPTSYQYIRGLADNGYYDLSFQEGLRHLLMASNVYEAGKKGGYVSHATLWENYSAEYVRNGYHGSNPNSRPNFAGWAGCLSVGTIIDDVLGLDINAPENKITWRMNLTEENGVSNLYMKHNGVVNRVSLLAQERASARDGVSFTVTATQDFTLEVINGTHTQTYLVTAGTHSYNIAGETGLPGYIGAIARSFEEVKGELTKEKLDASASDYVFFGTALDPAIKDGLQQQVRKGSALLYNVNTVGYAAKSSGNPIMTRENEELQSIGFTGAQDVVKRLHSNGPEGFMVMAPAKNAMQTLRVIVGVQNGKGSLTAILSDASDAVAKVPLYGGAQEEVYVLDIPFRAASDNRNVLLKWTIDETLGAATGNVSLKGIALLEGGQPVPGVPANLTLTAGDGTIQVQAQPPKGEAYDSWKIYYGLQPNQLTQVVATSNLPHTLDSLVNFQKYYVAVSGVKDGLESTRTDVAWAIPEPEGTTDALRAQKDLEAALPTILNGNTEAATQYDLLISTIGPIYGSTFTLSSSTHNQSNGIMNDGSVVRPLDSAADKPSDVTITAHQNAATAEKSFHMTVKSIDTAGPYVIDTTQSMFTGNVYLTQEGTKDWAQIRDDINGENPQARKAGGSGIGTFRRYHNVNVGNQTGVMTDANLYYLYTDGSDPYPINRYGGHIRGESNYLEFDLAYSEKAQRVYVYGGVWHAEARVDFLVNGVVQASEMIRYNDLRQCRIGFDFKLAQPTDQAVVRMTLLDMSITSGNTSGSCYLNAVTLQEIDSPHHFIPAKTEPPKNPMKMETTPFSGTLNLTQEGANDWFQLPQDSETDYARKAGGSGLSGFQRNHTAVPDGEKGCIRDGSIYYTYTDANPSYPSPRNQYGMQCRGVGNGFEFKVGYSAKPQKLNVYTGVWQAKAKVEYIVNGTVQYQTDIANQTQVGIFRTTIDFQLVNPTDVAVIRLTLTDNNLNGNHFGSAFIFGATLGDFKAYGEDLGAPVLSEQFARKSPGQDPNIENCGLGGKNIGGLSRNTWLTYNLDMEKSGVYDITFQYAAESQRNPNMSILLDDQPIASVTSIAPTGGWQNWSYHTVYNLQLPAGAHVLKLNIGNGGINLRQMLFKNATGIAFDKTQAAVNEEFQVMVTCPVEVEGIFLSNAEGLPLSLKNLTSRTEGPKKIFTATMKLGTVGNAREIQVILDYGNGKPYVDSGTVGTIDITQTSDIPQVLKVEAPAQMKVNVPTTIRVTTNLEGSYSANIYNAASKLGKTVVSKTMNSDGTCTWALGVKVGTAGKDRTLTAVAGNKNGTLSQPFPFQVTVTLI